MPLDASVLCHSVSSLVIGVRDIHCVSTCARVYSATQCHKMTTRLLCYHYVYIYVYVNQHISS